MEFLTFNGSVVTAGQFGAWTPVAAKQVGNGFEVVWSNGGANTCGTSPATAPS